MTITNATSADAGNYSCVARVGDQAVEHLVVLDLAFPGKLVKKTDGPIRRNSTDSNNVTLQCVFEGISLFIFICLHISLLRYV